jgi:hypothetical protein
VSSVCEGEAVAGIPRHITVAAKLKIRRSVISMKNMLGTEKEHKRHKKHKKLLVVSTLVLFVPLVLLSHSPLDMPADLR